MPAPPSEMDGWATVETPESASALHANLTPRMPLDMSLPIPSDPKMMHMVLDVGGDWPMRYITTRRVGPSGASYSIRLYNCGELTVMYMGFGETLEEAKAGMGKAQSMSPVVPEAVSAYVGHFACMGGA